jgi:hypothetical protein
MAFGDGIFVVGRRSKQFYWVTHVFCSGVRFFIWATVIFRFAGTGLKNRDRKTIKSHESWILFWQKLKKLRKGKPARCDFPTVFFVSRNEFLSGLPLRPVLMAIPLPTLFGFLVYVSAFPLRCKGMAVHRRLWRFL